MIFERRRLPLLLLASTLCCGASCVRQPPAPAPPPPPEVTVSQPIEREVTEFHDHTGRTEPVEMVEVRVRVKGFLSAVHFQEGAPVKKGDLLYEIDPRTFEADLASARAEFARLEASSNQATSELERAKRLRASRTITEEEFIQRVATRDQAVAAVDKAQAQARSVALELSFTKIYSPIDGVISRTLVTEGNLVGYNEPTLLTTIVKIDPIYVFFDASERELLEYEQMIRDHGLASAEDAKVPVFIGLTTEKGFPHEGVINFRENRVDPTTGTIRLRGVFANPDRLLLPGLFVRVRVPIGKPHPRLLVPEAALGADQRGRFVLAVNAENTVEYRPITVGASEDDKLVVVLGGVKPEDWVVVNGVQRARPGSKVTPKRKTLSAAESPAKAT